MDKSSRNRKKFTENRRRTDGKTNYKGPSWNGGLSGPIKTRTNKSGLKISILPLSMVLTVISAGIWSKLDP